MMFSEAVLTKARSYVEAGAVLQDARDDAVWWVQPADPTERPYRVVLIVQDGQVTSRSCTCRHGQSALGGARCSHIVASLLRLRDSRTD